MPGPWNLNRGEQPVDDGMRVAVVLRDDLSIHLGSEPMLDGPWRDVRVDPAETWGWRLEECASDILAWRLEE
jgi:hypothetical protein